jgi:hypothetical protein
VGLHVLTEFHFAVSVEVQFAVEYDLKWALRLGDATLQGKNVAPEHGCVYHFYHYDRRQVIKRDYVVIAVNSVFDGSVVLFNLWDVLVLRCDVKPGMQVRKVATHWLKLIVCKHVGDFETSGDVRTNQHLEVLEYVVSFHLIQPA